MPGASRSARAEREEHQRDLSDEQTKEEQVIRDQGLYEHGRAGDRVGHKGCDRESGAHPAVHRPEEGGGALRLAIPVPPMPERALSKVSMGPSSLLSSLEENRTDVEGDGESSRKNTDETVTRPP